MLYLFTCLALAGTSVSTVLLLFSIILGGPTQMLMRIAGCFLVAVFVFGYFYVRKDGKEIPYE